MVASRSIGVTAPKDKRVKVKTANSAERGTSSVAGPEDLQGRVQCSMVLEKCGIVHQSGIGAGHHGRAKWGWTRRASCMEHQSGAGPQDARTRAKQGQASPS